MKSGSKFVKVGLAMIYFNRRTIKLSILINYKANIKQIVNAVLIKKIQVHKIRFPASSKGNDNYYGHKLFSNGDLLVKCLLVHI